MNSLKRNPFTEVIENDSEGRLEDDKIYRDMLSQITSIICNVNLRKRS